MLRCFPPSRRASVAAAFALLPLSSASARALTIKPATVTRHPIKGDTFAIQSELARRRGDRGCLSPTGCAGGDSYYRTLCDGKLIDGMGNTAGGD